MFSNPTKLNLAQKGLVLILVPLISVTLILCTSSLLVYQLERESARGRQSREFLTSLQRITLSLDTAMMSLLRYVRDRDRRYIDQYESSRRKVLDYSTALLSSCAEHYPQRLDAVQRIESMSHKTMELLDEIEHEIGEGTLSGKATSLQTMGRIATGQAVLHQLEVNILRLVESEEELQRANPEQSDRLREAIKTCNLFSAIASIAIAATLWAFFNKNTSRQMATLMENTRLLSQGRQLNPPLEGQDELCHLDHTFHEMAEALAHARRKERAIVENASDIISALDSALCFTFISPACYSAWGYHPEELKRRPALDLVHPDDREISRTTIEEAIVSAARTIFENRVLRADGRPADMLWSVQWVPGEERIYAVVHDITERKEAERFRHQLVAMVGHDLKTPLTSVLSILQQLQTNRFGALNDTGKNKLRNAEQCVRDLIRLIKDLLDIEVIEAGKLELKWEDTQTEALISRSVEQVNSLADEKNIQIEWNCDVSIVRLDPNRIAQALTNLLSNAVKFSPAGSQIQIAVTCVSDSCIEVSVTDQGRGITQRHQKLIFERFQQIDEGDRNELGGTGLGLPIARAIVEAHGGQIGVRLIPSAAVFSGSACQGFQRNKRGVCTWFYLLR